MTPRIDDAGRLLMAAVQNNPALMKLAEDTVSAPDASTKLGLLRTIETWQARAASIQPAYYGENEQAVRSKLNSACGSI